MAYIANTDADRARMLARLGAPDIDALFAEIPAELRLKRRLDLPRPAAEPEVLRAAGALAERNADTRRYACFIGAGAYDHYIPSAVGHMLLRSEFYTAYTPYQPEISQGTLQCIYEYQSLIAELTGQDVANASMYDGASALAEAGLVAHNATGRRRILLAGGVHPEHARTVRTYVQGLDLLVETLPADGTTLPDDVARALGPDVACVALQQPNFFGGIEDVAAVAKLARAAGALTVVAANPIALGLLEAPGRLGADIVVGEGQPLGVALSYGGPYVGFFAVKQALMRLLPGRIVGATVDGQGRRGFVLTLQTREQHIRRERATSNICTNQALMALANTVYLTLLGPQGLRETAEACVEKAHYAAERIAALPGYELVHDTPFFYEFVVATPVPAARIVEGLLQRRLLAGFDLGRIRPEWDHRLLVCVTEARTKAEIDALVAGLEAVK